MSLSDPARQLLRHTIATLAYRGARTLRGAPESFASFQAGQGARTPVEILAHVSDLFDWALSIARGQEQWGTSGPLAWEDEVRRFFTALEAFDGYLASGSPVHASAEKLFQAPIADALTHLGQIALLRRLAGTPIGSENYYVAKISIGSVGSEQPDPVFEF
jgi:hypothetical protein